MSTPTHKFLRDSLISMGDEQVETKKAESFDSLASGFALFLSRANGGKISEKVVAMFITLFEQINDEESRDQAISRLTTGAGAVAIDPRGALQVIMTSMHITPGQKNSIERVLTPSHPDAISVDETGTSLKEIKLQKTIDKLEAENKALTDGKKDDSTTPAESTVKSVEDLKNKMLPAVKKLQKSLATYDVATKLLGVRTDDKHLVYETKTVDDMNVEANTLYGLVASADKQAKSA